MTERLDRRYTDQEVALVLHRATQIEERRPTAPAAVGGLTLRDLHEIAREVGLSPAVIDEAVAGLQSGSRRRTGSMLGASLSAKAVRAVDGRLGAHGLNELMRAVEERVDTAGTVTEALGTVRWTSVARGHKFDRTMQVTVSPTDDETRIQVVGRYPSGFRALLHGLPGLWGAMFGASAAASAGLGALAVLGGGVGAAIVGVGIGRAIWHGVSRRSARLVDDVARDLADLARGQAAGAIRSAATAPDPPG